MSTNKIIAKAAKPNKFVESEKNSNKTKTAKTFSKNSIVKNQDYGNLRNERKSVSILNGANGLLNTAKDKADTCITSLET